MTKKQEKYDELWMKAAAACLKKDHPSSCVIAFDAVGHGRTAF